MSRVGNVERCPSAGLLLIWIGAAMGFVMIEVSMRVPWVGLVCWVSLVPLCRLQMMLRPARSAVAVGVACLVMYLVISHPYRLLSPLGSVVVPLAAAALCGGGAYAVSWLHRGSRWWPAMVASVWTLLEVAKGELGMEHGSVGYTQWSIPGVRGVASVTGALGLSWAVWFVNAWLAFLVAPTTPQGDRRSGDDERVRRRGWWAAAVAVVVVVTIAAITARPARSERTLRVMVVPGDTSTEQRIESRARPHLKHELLASHVRASADALRGTSGPRLVVWSETACQFHVELEHDLLAKTFADARFDPGVVFLIGGFGGTPHALSIGLNSLYLLDHRGNVIDRYDKVRLIPFDEYQPLRAISGLILSRVVFTEFDAGKRVTTLRTAGGDLALSVCYEESFGSGFRTGVRRGGRVMLTLANYSYFESPLAPRYMHALAVMRAVENRRWLVRSANFGPCEFIDPSGRTVQRLGIDPAGDPPALGARRMSRDVPMNSGLTIYTAGGWTLPVVVPSIFVAAGVIRRGTRRSRSA